MDSMQSDGRRNWGWLRYLGWGGAVALILTPLAAMKFAPAAGFNWTVGDFIFAAMMFGIVGLAFELVVRATPSWASRFGAALALGTGFLLVWANLAVGYIGSEDNPYNQWFFGIVALAFLGAVLARFRARGLAVAMTVTALAHAIVGAVGFPQDTRTGPITLVFTGLWLASALLFRKAAEEGAGQSA